MTNQSTQDTNQIPIFLAVKATHDPARTDALFLFLLYKRNTVAIPLFSKAGAVSIIEKISDKFPQPGDTIKMQILEDIQKSLLPKHDPDKSVLLDLRLTFPAGNPKLLEEIRAQMKD